MNNSDFPSWVDSQLKVRHWTEADLISRARERGYRLDPSHLNRVLNREKGAGVQTVITIAHGLGVSREEAFRARGWLLPSAEETLGLISAEIDRKSNDPRLLEFVTEILDLSEPVRSALLESMIATLRTVQVALDQDGNEGAAKQWIPVQEAADQSGYAVRTIQLLAKQGKIERWQPSTELFTTLESVLEYRESMSRGRSENND